MINCLTSGRLLAAQFSPPGNVDNEMKLSPDRFVDPGSIAGREDREPGIFSSPQQEIIDFNVGVAVVAVFHVRTFAKKSIRFVEEQDAVTILRRNEDTAKILLCLANIFGGDGLQVDPV